MNHKLRIGKIPYANLFPVFYALEKECDCSSYEFIEDAPSVLNKMLRNGELDISPSSSVEYLRNPSLYRIIQGHSISSRGAVRSILLFTKKPIESLNNSTIYVSSQSEASVALLEIILIRFYGIKCLLKPSRHPESSESDAFLLIGDDALKYGKSVSRDESHDAGKNSALNLTIDTRHSLLIYDLGDIWYKQTGLPFVFALWIARKKQEDNKLLNRFIQDLNRAKETALKNLPDIAKHTPANKFMTEKEIVSYWNIIDYDLTESHLKGLGLFDKYLKAIR